MVLGVVRRVWLSISPLYTHILTPMRPYVVAASAKPYSMSALKVCSGIVPSWYVSLRAISAPPRRPDTITFIPRTPSRIALLIAFFIARRNPMRFSSFAAMPSAISCAFVSGFLTSTIESATDLPILFSSV